MSVPGFFTGIPVVRLPHPPVPLRVILTTHLALVRAFELLRSEPPTGFVLRSAKEDEITRQLQWIMENRLLRSGEVSGFDTRRFKNIIRAPEVTNYDGQHPAKKPDLVLFLLKRESLLSLRSHDGIFAECKPVDDEHPIGTHYCDSGIRRFVDGDYGWAMQEGMMIAYVRGKRSISRDLAPELSSSRRHAALGSPTGLSPFPSPMRRDSPNRSTRVFINAPLTGPLGWEKPVPCAFFTPGMIVHENSHPLQKLNRILLSDCPLNICLHPKKVGRKVDRKWGP